MKLLQRSMSWGSAPLLVLVLACSSTGTMSAAMTTGGKAGTATGGVGLGGSGGGPGLAQGGAGAGGLAAAGGAGQDEDAGAAGGGGTGEGGGSAGEDAAVDGPAANGAFKHPGVLWSRAELDLMRAKVMAGAQPWKGAYDKALARYGGLDYKAQPFAVVECGSYSNPNNGCSEERNDAVAAYTHALAWYVTRDDAHAKKAIEIMGAWARTLK